MGPPTIAVSRAPVESRRGDFTTLGPDTPARPAMNVGILIDSTGWGGAEIHALGFTRYLLDRGHMATLVSLSRRAHVAHRSRLDGQIPTSILNVLDPSRRVGYGTWYRVFAEQPWDVCLLIKGDIHSGGGCAIDLAARRCFGRYLVLEQKDADPIGPKTTSRHFGVLPGLGLWWYREQVRRYARSIGPRKIVCVSEANRRRLANDHRFPEHKLETVHNGADVQRFRRKHEARDAWRRRWGVPGDALVFGAVGRLHPIKGYGTALDGFEATLSRYPEAKMWLVLVGSGPDEAVLRARAEQIRRRGRVIFLPFVEQPEEVLSAFDVFVMPSLNEGLPLALAEAMACECCPIATAVGGIPEAVCGPELGWLVPANDSDAFAKAMIDAASRTHEERARMGRNARQKVVECFNSAVQFDALARILESLDSVARFRCERARHATRRAQ